MKCRWTFFLERFIQIYFSFQVELRYVVVNLSDICWNVSFRKVPSDICQNEFADLNPIPVRPIRN